MDSTDTKPSSSRLETLPNELLRDVFEMAYDRDDLDMTLASTPRPISKRSLPFQHYQLFADVRLTTYKQLASFARAVVDTQELEKMIKRLWVDIEPEDICVQGVKIESSFPDSLFPANLLARLLQTLTHLKKLTLQDYSEVVRRVLSLPLTITDFLPCLSELELDSTFDFTNDPFETDHLRALSMFPRLETLSIFVNRAANGLNPSTPPTGPLPPLPSVLSFTTRGPFNRASNVVHLVSQLVNLKALDLSSENPYPEVPSPATPLAMVLLHLLNPAALRILIFESAEANDWASDAFFVFLAEFPNLVNLLIDGLVPEGIILSPRFYETILSLPLRRLELGAHLGGLNLADLIRLVETPHRKLRHLTLAQRVDDDGLGGWYEGFGTEDVDELVEVAREWGVRVDGTAVEACDAVHEESGRGSQLSAVGDGNEERDGGEGGPASGGEGVEV
ncbi:hypothetical protein JCM10207_008468 [Rhodosporidiobolus poonsookiae]